MNPPDDLQQLNYASSAYRSEYVRVITIVLGIWALLVTCRHLFYWIINFTSAGNDLYVSLFCAVGEVCGYWIVLCYIHRGWRGDPGARTGLIIGACIASTMIAAATLVTIARISSVQSFDMLMCALAWRFFSGLCAIFVPTTCAILLFRIKP